jgi:Membrane proteins related to metalloendopeptidases
MMVPVEGVEPRVLRDTFHEGRDGGRTHNATDILAPRGTPVLAAIAGEIARMSQNALGGITLYLTDNERRYVYYYAHLDRYADQVTPGMKVEEGTVIGTSEPPATRRPTPSSPLSGDADQARPARLVERHTC